MDKNKTLARQQWERAVQNNDFQQADRLFFKLKDDGQLDYEISYVMGIWYRQMKQYANSVGALGLGLASQPDSYELYYEVGNTLMEMEMYDTAERQYRASLTLKPGNAEAWYGLGRSLAEQEKNDEAEQAFCKALQFIDTVEEMIVLAVEFSALGNADQAIHVYYQAMLIEPENFYLFSNIGVELAEQGDYADAVFCHEKALQMAPENADIWYNAACTYAQMNEAMRGLLALEKAVTLDPENKAYAMQDEELDNLRKHKRFWKLIKG